MERQDMCIRCTERSAQSHCGDTLAGMSRATLECSGPLHSQGAPLLLARLDSDTGSAAYCVTLGMSFVLSTSVTQYLPHGLFRRSYEVIFALHTADTQ